MTDNKRQTPSSPQEEVAPGALSQRLDLLRSVVDASPAASLDGVPAEALRSLLTQVLAAPRLSARVHADVCALAEFYAVAATGPRKPRFAVAPGERPGVPAALERLPEAVFGEVAVYLDGGDLLGALVGTSRRLLAEVTAPGRLRCLALGDARTAARAADLLSVATWAALDTLRLELARPPPASVLRATQCLGPRLRALALCGPVVDVRMVPLAAWAAIHTCSVDEKGRNGGGDWSVVHAAPYLMPGTLRALRNLSLSCAEESLHVPTPAFEVLTACAGSALRLLSLQCATYTPQLQGALVGVAPWLEELCLCVCENFSGFHHTMLELPPLPRAHTIVLQSRSWRHGFRLANRPHLALQHLRAAGGGLRCLEVGRASAPGEKPRTASVWAVGALREVLFPAQVPLELLQAFLPGFGPQLRRLRLEVPTPAVFEWALEHMFPHVEDLSFLSPSATTATERRRYVAALLALPRLRRLGLDDCKHLTTEWWAAQQCGPALREVAYPEEAVRPLYHATERPAHWPAHVKWTPAADLPVSEEIFEW